MLIFGIGAIYADPLIIVEPSYYTIFLLVWFVIVFVFLCVLGIRNKKVFIDDQKFIVSNYINKIIIPFSNIENINGTTLVTPEQVRIILKSKCKFGKIICFMPQFRYITGHTLHPIVEELKHQISNSNGLCVED